MDETVIRRNLLAAHKVEREMNNCCNSVARLLHFLFVLAKVNWFMPGTR